MYRGMKRYPRIHQKPTPPPSVYASRRSLLFRNARKFLIMFSSAFFCFRSSLIPPIRKMKNAKITNTDERRKTELVPNLLATNPARSGPMTKAMFVKVNQRPSFLDSLPFLDLSFTIRPKLVTLRVPAIVSIPATIRKISKDSTKYSNA